MNYARLGAVVGWAKKRAKHFGSPWLAVAALVFNYGVANGQEACESLAPKGGEEISERFSGEIQGEIEGLIARIAGANATIEGEYERLVKDSLQNYPKPDRIYAWQSIIYLACVKGDDSIDINRLFELFIAGPPEKVKETLGFGYYYNALGSGNSQLQSEAVGWFIKQAVEGDTNSKTILGHIFCRRGLGYGWMEFDFSGDCNQGKLWYREAASEGDGEALWELGTLCEEEAEAKGTPKPWNECAELIERALSTGFRPG